MQALRVRACAPRRLQCREHNKCVRSFVKPLCHYTARVARVQAKQDDAPESAAREPVTSGDDAAPSNSDSQSEPESTSGASDNEELDVVEKLKLAVTDGNVEDAKLYMDAVVAEVVGLTSIVEAKDEQLKSTQATLEQLKDQYRRLQADFDNFRTRANNEKQQAGANAKMSMIEDLLPLIDSFELASSQVKTETPGEEKINNSYQGMYKKMVDIFRNMGLEAVASEGTQFDPEIHDGIMREETNEVENGTVLQEFRKGFTFKGKLLRPAMVKVAYSDDSASTNGASEEVQESSKASSSD